LPGGLTVVCHKGKKSKLLPAKALPAHLRHGDVQGVCSGDEADILCHKERKTKLYPARALAAHLEHGDTLGACAQ
jgi:hypothetical protein